MIILMLSYVFSSVINVRLSALLIYLTRICILSLWFPNVTIYLLILMTFFREEVIFIKRYPVDPGADRSYFKRTAAKIKAINLPYVLHRGGFRF